MKEQLYTILEKLIVKNKINFNKDELKLQLLTHPSYPSLHAITGVLDHMEIPNLALRLNATKEILVQLPVVFMANIKSDKGEQLVLVERKKKTVTIGEGTKKTKALTHEEFLEAWDGVVVAIEKDETVIEVTNNRASGILRWGLGFLVFLTIAYVLYSSTNMFSQWHFVLSAIGVFASVFIVKHELGLQSEAANSFCNLSSKTSCDAVLDSEGALLLGIFKLSDLSIVSFSAYCLCWVVFAISDTSGVSLMSIPTVLAFPFIIYSLYYQYKVVKKWCPLCLSIVAILGLQIVALIVSGFSITTLTFDLKSVSILIVSTLASVVVWNYIKQLLLKKQDLAKLEVEHYKFKRNFSVFNALYNQGKKFSIANEFPGEIVLGNANATLELILVTSPLCFYCKKAHSDIETILKKAEDKIKVTIRFNVDTSNKGDELYKITSRLLDIYNTYGESSVLSALEEVFSENANHKAWLANQTNPLSNSYDYTLNEQYNWCQSQGINFTPALYMNNIQFPKEYDRKDLMYFIDDIIEQQQEAMELEINREQSLLNI